MVKQSELWDQENAIALVLYVYPMFQWCGRPKATQEEGAPSK